MNERIQEARKKLIIKRNPEAPELVNRVLTFDPDPIYQRMGDKISPFKRVQSLFMWDLFEFREDGICACGCEQKLSGRRKRYDSEDCSRFCNIIYCIITGRMETIRHYLQYVYEFRCCECSKTEREVERIHKDDWRTPIELEHILPVKHGGGGCWLSNYKFMCYVCHRGKTNKDFGFKSKKVTDPKPKKHSIKFIRTAFKINIK